MMMREPVSSFARVNAIEICAALPPYFPGMFRFPIETTLRAVPEVETEHPGNYPLILIPNRTKVPD